MVSKGLTPAPLNPNVEGCAITHTHTEKIISLPSPAAKSSGLIAQLMRTITFAAGLPPPVEEESQPKAYKTLQL